MDHCQLVTVRTLLKLSLFASLLFATDQLLSGRILRRLRRAVDRAHDHLVAAELVEYMQIAVTNRQQELAGTRSWPALALWR